MENDIKWFSHRGYTQVVNILSVNDPRLGTLGGNFTPKQNFMIGYYVSMEREISEKPFINNI